MMQFTEEQKAALTEYARNAIKQAEEARDEIPFGLSEEEEMEISLFAIALERLNATAPQPVPDGWTHNSDADAALVMLDRIDTLDPADDGRIEDVKRIIRKMAAALEAK